MTPEIAREDDMTEEELEQALERATQAGTSEGLRLAANHVMDQAKNDFERFGCDNAKAGRLRHIANELHCKANAAHPGDYTRDHEKT